MLLILMYHIQFASAQLFACHTNKSQIPLPPGGVAYDSNRMTATQPSLLLLCLWHHAEEEFQTALSPASIT